MGVCALLMCTHTRPTRVHPHTCMHGCAIGMHKVLTPPDCHVHPVAVQSHTTDARGRFKTHTCMLQVYAGM